MARKTQKDTEWKHSHAQHKILMGIFAFLFGAVLYLGYGWGAAFMTLGVLIALKGFWMKSKT